MSDTGILSFGMLVFGVAICSTLIGVLGGNVTPAEETKSPEKKTDFGSNVTAVAGNR